MASLADIARSTAAHHAMFAAAGPVLVMVSGGADSVALLRLLAEGALGPHAADLTVLHVNHGLRGADADADEAFVAELAASLGVRCETVRVDVAGYAAAAGLNLEDAGRRVRYRFAEDALDARCAALGVAPGTGRIAVAHTFDDRLETFLARMVRGAGSGGLRSIPPVRGRIVRPLIDARRADVVAYLEGLGQAWCEDVTNADTAAERAWVRHELLPLVEQRNPAFGVTAARTLGILAEEDDLLAGMAAAFARDFSSISERALIFDRPRMLTLSRPMARRTVRTALFAAFPEAARLEFEHVEALVDGMADAGFARDLPFGLRARAEYDRVRISRSDDHAVPLVPGLLELPGRVELGGGGVIEARETPVARHPAGGDRAIIDADAVSWPLVVDAPREGDRMQPFGMAGTKKVSDLLTEAKVPRRLRPAVPVVRDAAGVVWVAGVRLAERCKIGPGTTRAATIVWHRPGTSEERTLAEEEREA